MAITDRLSNAMNIQRAGGGCHRLDLALVQLAAVGCLGRIHDTLRPALPAANQGGDDAAAQLQLFLCFASVGSAAIWPINLLICE